MLGICKLHGIEEDLKESHIYPAFAIRYMKDSGSKYFRNKINPNQRMQDGVKKHLLCEEAEQKFSVSEKWFAEKIFSPYLDGEQRKFDYNEHLYYFAISFLWRVLLNTLSVPEIQQLSYISKLNQVEEEWRLFLGQMIFPRNFSSVNLFFSDRVKSHDLNASGADYYLSRALDGTIGANQNGTSIMVYGKFLRFIFWAEVYPINTIKIPEVTIDPAKGQIGPPQIIESKLGNFLAHRIELIDSLPKPSTKQQAKIVDEIMKDPEAFLSSDAGKAIVNDKTNLNPKKPDISEEGC